MKEITHQLKGKTNNNSNNTIEKQPPVFQKPFNCYMSFSNFFSLQQFYNVFQAKNQEPHIKCPLHSSRDLYSVQEGNKIEEYASKWVCNLCGKAFYAEHYLDLHFDNRHSDKLVKVRVCYLLLQGEFEALQHHLI